METLKAQYAKAEVNVDKIVEEANWLIDNGYDSHDLWETFCATGRVGSLVADYKRYAMVPVSWDGEPCDEFAWIICDTEEEASEIAHEQLSLDYPTAYIVEYDSLNGEPIGDGPKTVINATYSVWDKASRKNYTFMPAYHPDFRAMADLADEIAKRHGQEVLPDEYDLWDVIDALKSAGCDVSVN